MNISEIRVHELLLALKVHINKHSEPNNMRNNEIYWRKKHKCIREKTWWTNSNVRFDNQSHLFDNRFHQLSDRNFGHKERKKP